MDATAAPETPVKPPRARGKLAAEVAPKRQCAAMSKQSGERCKRAPIRGGSVCKIHGGGAPQVQKSARARLAEEVMPSISRLATERDNDEATPSERIRAATAILDRSGYGPSVGIQLDDARSSLAAKLRALKEAGAIGPAAGESDIIDAEVIED